MGDCTKNEAKGPSKAGTKEVVEECEETDTDLSLSNTAGRRSLSSNSVSSRTTLSPLHALIQNLVSQKSLRISRIGAGCTSSLRDSGRRRSCLRHSSDLRDVESLDALAMVKLNCNKKHNTYPCSASTSAVLSSSSFSLTIKGVSKKNEKSARGLTGSTRSGTFKKTRFESLPIDSSDEVDIQRESLSHGS